MYRGMPTISLPEPERPPFVDRLRRALDLAAAEESGRLRVVHSWVGDEVPGTTLRRVGWQSRVLTITGPRRAPIDVWFDADDGDVTVIGDVSVPDWSLHDAEAESACLAASGQLLHDLASGRLPRGRRSDFVRSSTVLALLGAGAVVGAVVVDVLRARGRGRSV
ncbi:hypothetical protein [Frigoribacterium sp. Leaf186]|uniref:hypothetical protein n=1 Tax=Frigoribacterium sp. Leaf186 TaxID=1736293 RepID=UPI0006F90ADD|nr:hypothetical protein [Frigoribacterium sp. Leaf186]